jgi:hypothetical protein
MEVAVVVAVITVVVVAADEVEVEVAGLITINKDRGSNHMHRNISGPILLGMHSGSRGPLLPALILPPAIGKDQ